VSVRVRSEGALDEVEQAIAKYEQIERLLRFSVESAVAELPSVRLEPSAIVRLERLDDAPVQRLREVQERVAELARKQLRDRNIVPTSSSVDDLLAQLIARAHVRQPAKPRRRAPRAVISWGLWISAFGITWWMRDYGMLSFVPFALVAIISLVIPRDPHN
jgi:hypothetical protein